MEHHRSALLQAAPPLPRLESQEVVKACGWSDGGAEFVFGDGTVLVFQDEMNTFTALNPPEATLSRTARRSAALPPKDMVCTAWTLSAYQLKVAEALRLYNRYSPYPRLLPFLSDDDEALTQRMESGPDPASSLHVSPSRFPLDTLLLARDPRLLERREILALVQPMELRTPSPERANCSSPPPDETMVRIGEEITLWCLLHRVSLTVHYHRQLFTVRWPASTAAARDHSNSVTGLAVEGETPSAQVWWVEQVFPVATPPREWDAMLSLVWELEKETASSSSSPSSCSSYTQQTLRLPRMGMESGGMPLRFAHVEASDREAFTAARDLALVDCQKVLHPTPSSVLALGDGADEVRLLWQWCGESSSREAHALYWYLAAAVLPSHTHPSDGHHACGGVALGSGSAVVALVREDESVIRVQRVAHGHPGFEVLHHRLDGREKLYYVEMEAALWREESLKDRDHLSRSSVAEEGLIPSIAIQSVPATTGPLQFLAATATPGAGDASPLITVRPEGVSSLVARPSSAALPSSKEVPLHPVCSAFKDRSWWGVSTLPIPLRDQEELHLSSGGALPATAGGGPFARGRYLSLVTTHSINLLMGAEYRVANVHRVDSDSPLSGASLYQRVYPLMSSEEAQLAANLDPTVYRPFLQHVATASSSRLPAEKDVVNGTAFLSPHQPEGSSSPQPSRSLFQSMSTSPVSLYHRPREEDDFAAVGMQTAEGYPSGVSPHRARPSLEWEDKLGLLPGSITLTSLRVEGVGNFTAWRNGTVRCHFDDRTIISVFPGPPDPLLRHYCSFPLQKEEEHLVAQCLFRDATRASVRVSQCGPTHRAAPYLRFLLPFRSQLVAELLDGTGLGCSDPPADEEQRARWQLQDKEQSLPFTTSTSSGRSQTPRTEAEQLRRDPLFESTLLEMESRSPSSLQAPVSQPLSRFLMTPQTEEKSAGRHAGMMEMDGIAPTGQSSSCSVEERQGAVDALGHWSAMQQQLDRVAEMIAANEKLKERNRAILESTP